MKRVLICMAFSTLLLSLNDSYATEKIIQETKGDQSPAVNIAPGGSSSIIYQSAAPIIDGSLKPFSSTSSDFITVYLGNSLIIYPRERLLKGLPLNVLDSFIQSDAKHDIIIKLRENKLLVSATVYTLDKKIVAALDDNEWAINEHNYFTRNYDDSG